MRLMFAVGAAAMLQACAATDPQLNQNDWHPSGANERNIAAQVVNPMDLLHGRTPAGGADGARAAAAIARLRADHIKPLPDSGIADLKLQGSSSPTGSP